MTSEPASLAVIDGDADGYDEVVLDLAAVTGAAPGDEDVAPAEPIPPAELWDASERYLWAYVLAEHRQTADDALYALEDAVRDGRRPTAAEITQAREAFDQARALLEDYYADLAADVAPWDAGVGGRVPYGVMRDQLDERNHRRDADA